MSETTVTLVAAIVSTVIGVGAFFHYFLSILRWPRATGTVVGNVAKLRSTEGTRYAYFPRIAFQAANGQAYDVQGDIGLSDPWPIGRNVALRYRAANPNHTTIAKWWQRLIFSAVFLCFAAALWYAWSGMPDP
ncbi:MAG TPA: DUF3592 domain-containing protein [Kiloniellaceae bacterium]|nr:DUF3592 domain-containing protein [Kiloniellaceae bacterium]